MAASLLRRGRMDASPLTHDDIPGTIVFDGRQAMKGYALNKMCFSFNSAANRDAFRRDEDAYFEKFGIPLDQRDAMKRRDVLALIRGGGNIYYLAKWAGILGLNVQQVGALQRGMTEEAFREMLRQESA
jgi:protocatechuate 4,5-dioxygenase alpha chain